jgi:hypothetical protein
MKFPKLGKWKLLGILGGILVVVLLVVAGLASRTASADDPKPTFAGWDGHTVDLTANMTWAEGSTVNNTDGTQTTHWTGVATTAKDKDGNEIELPDQITQDFDITGVPFTQPEGNNGQLPSGAPESPDGFDMVSYEDCSLCDAATFTYVVGGTSFSDAAFIFVYYAQGHWYLAQTNRAFGCGDWWFCFGRTSANSGHNCHYEPFAGTLGSTAWCYIDSDWCF